MGLKGDLVWTQIRFLVLVFWLGLLRSVVAACLLQDFQCLLETCAPFSPLESILYLSGCPAVSMVKGLWGLWKVTSGSGPGDFCCACSQTCYCTPRGGANPRIDTRASLFDTRSSLFDTPCWKVCLLLFWSSFFPAQFVTKKARIPACIL